MAAITLPDTLAGTITTTLTVKFTAGGDISSDDASSTVTENVSLIPDPTKPGRFVDDGTSTWSATFREAITFTDGGATTEDGSGSGHYTADQIDGFLEAYQPPLGFPTRSEWITYSPHGVRIPTTIHGPNGNEQTAEDVEASGCSSVTAGDPDLGTFKVTNPGQSETAALNCSTTFKDGAATDKLTMTGSLHTGCMGTDDASDGEPRHLHAAAAAAPSTCLLITSPRKDGKIALTDRHYVEPYHSHPLKDNERAPQHKSLIVKGTDACGCPVTVNGVEAKMDGHDWTAEIPNLSPGELTITAKANSTVVTQQNTLVELSIANPTENDLTSYRISTVPKMPDISAKVTLKGSSPPASTTVQWALQMYANTVTRAGWEASHSNVAAGSAQLTAAWHPDYSTIVGGWARLQATATIPGLLDETVVSDPRWFDITGTNPGRDLVKQFIAQSHNPTQTNIVSHIFCHESGYLQFNPAPDPGAWANTHHPGHDEPASKGDQIPADWPGSDNPGPNRPLFGGPPAGVGVAQKDPSDYPDQQWDWQANARAGFEEWDADRRYSAALLPHDEQVRINSEFDGTLSDFLLAAGVPGRVQRPDGVNPITVPDLTADQHTLDAIRRYKFGRKTKDPRFVFDAHYQVVQNNVDGHTSSSIVLVGSQAWIHRPLRLKPTEEDYPANVISCAAGQPLVLNDPASNSPGRQTQTVYVAAATGDPFPITVGGLPGGIPIHIELHSNVVQLTTGRTNAAGVLNADLVIPAGTPVGQHAIVVSDGRPADTRTIAVEVTTSQETQTQSTSSTSSQDVEVTTSREAPSQPTSPTTPQQSAGHLLVDTGADIGGLAQAALLLVLSGATMTWTMRRRRTRRDQLD